MRNSADFWQARTLIGSAMLSKTCNTLEEMEKEVDESNARSMARGFKPLQYMITNVEIYVYNDDTSGQFIKREEIESAYEIYPATLAKEV